MCWTLGEKAKNDTEYDNIESGYIIWNIEQEIHTSSCEIRLNSISLCLLYYYKKTPNNYRGITLINAPNIIYKVKHICWCSGL